MTLFFFLSVHLSDYVWAAVIESAPKSFLRENRDSLTWMAAQPHQLRDLLSQSNHAYTLQNWAPIFISAQHSPGGLSKPC